WRPRSSSRALPCASPASAGWCRSTSRKPRAWPAPPEPGRENAMSDAWLLRIGILLAGILLFAAIWYFGTRPRSPQGRRIPAKPAAAGREQRMEPTLGAQLERELGEGDGSQAAADDTVQAEMELLDGAVGGTAGATVSQYGQRVSDDFD